MSPRWIVSLTALWLAAAAGAAEAGVVFGNEGLVGGYRWDAAPRMVGENERSLDGGLRYSLQGGSYEAFRDLFQWTTTPGVAEFQLAVEQAFAAWMAVDPVTGLHSELTFVADLATPVVGTGEFGGLDINGAEIDLFGIDAGISNRRAVVNLDVVEETVTLTSGTTDYAGSEAISGADVSINNNSEAKYNLNIFRRLLTHEIGHAIGLGDVDMLDGEEAFLDDNYDGTSDETALATLTNPWAMLVNPLDPAASPLGLYHVSGVVGEPGIKTAGVNILMESTNLGISADMGLPTDNPVTSLVPLVNDDFATRQFLYPSLVRDVDLAGDYNGDGTVDAADYTAWRDHLGQLVSLPNETATFGSVTGEDYDVWLVNFGTSIPTGAAAGSANLTSAVPEPASLALLAWAAAWVWWRPPSSRVFNRGESSS